MTPGLSALLLWAGLARASDDGFLRPEGTDCDLNGGNPIAGIDSQEIVDTRPYTMELQDFLTNAGDGNPEFTNLPRKWNTAVAGARDNFLLHNDIVFHPVEHRGVMGFGVWIGGILSSQMNAYAIPLNAWVRPDEICRMTAAVLTLWRDHGERDKRPKGRFRFYLDLVGLGAFRSMVEERYGPLTPDPGSVFDETPRSHYGIHPQKQADLHYAGLHVPVGRLKAEDFQDLATLAERHGAAEIRLTEDQNVILTGIPTANLGAFQAEPLLQRFSLQPSHLAAGTVSCTGNTYCSFALTNTKDQALAAAEQLDRELELPAELKIHWTGCPNSCGQAYMGAIGLTGTKARTPEGGMGEAYDITLGGRQGPDPQLGELHHKGVPASDIRTVLREILVQHFGARPRQV